MNVDSERILLIDDNPEFLKFLGQDVLPQYGYTTLLARSGREGLRLMAEQKPSLVLLDVQMPDISGLEVLEEMQKQGLDLPVVMMTAHGSESVAVKAFQLGAADYLIKPFDLGLARATIDRQLMQVHLRREKEELSRQLEAARRDLERRVRELSVLLGITKSVTSLLDLSKVLDRVVEAAVFVTTAEEGALWLPSEATQPDSELLLRAGKGLGVAEVDVLARLPSKGNLIGKVFQSASPLRMADGRDLSSRGELGIRAGYPVRALLAVPLMGRGQVLGVLSVANRNHARAFAASDDTMLQVLADFAAIAIQNAQAYQATDQALAQRMEELTHLYDIARTVTSTLDLAEILDLITAKISEMFHVEAGALLLLDDEEEELEFVASWMGDNTGLSEPLRGIRLKLKSVEAHSGAGGQGIAGQVAVSHQPAIVNDAYSDSRFFSQVDKATGFVTRSILCAPLLIGDRCLGVIELLNKLDGPFDSEDMERLTNVTGSVAIALENARLYSAAQELYEGQSRLVATMARELRSPLTTIKGYSEMLLSSQGTWPGPEDRGGAHLGMESARQIQANVTRLITLMEDLLDISRLETRETQLELQPVPVKDVVAQISSSLEQRLKEKNLRLSVKIPSRLPAVQADRERLCQVLNSLLTNAYCYTLPKGRIQVEAAAGPTRSEGSARSLTGAGSRGPGARRRRRLFADSWLLADRREGATEAATQEVVVVSVSDTGIGIAPEEQPRVFDRFFRGDHPIVRQHPGRGLSLSIAKSLVELHGGQIWVESEPGRGSVFRFALPAVVDD